MRELKVLKDSMTDRKEESLSRYFNDLGQIRMISPAEEVSLAQKIRKGDRVAEHCLVSANLRFVVACAKKYRKSGISFPDLICEGNLGLIRAAKSFDETRGFKFISYAVWWVRQSMMHALNEHARMIRLPMNQNRAIYEINQIALELEQQLEREPNIEELAEATGKSKTQLAEHHLASGRMQYLEDHIPGGETEDNTLLNYLAEPDGNVIDDWIRKEAMERDLELALSVLRKKEQRVLILGFGLMGEVPRDDEAVAEAIGMSPQSIRKIRYAALAKLRGNKEVQKLKAYI